MTKRLIGLAVGTIFVLALLIGLGADFVTDLWWFQSLGYQQLLLNSLLWQWGIRLVGWLVLSMFVFLNLQFTRPAVGKLLWRFPQVGRFLHARRVSSGFALLSVLVGFLYSSGVSAYFWQIATFFHQQAFGKLDPLFGRDLGFFLFGLPFWNIAGNLALRAILLTTLIVAAIYVASGSLQAEGLQISLEPWAKRHLSFLASFFILIRAALYLVDMYELVLSPGGAIFGAGYTDVLIRVPAYKVMAVLAVLTALVLASNLANKRKLLTLTLGGWLAVSFVLGGIVPALVQRWVVEPNEFSREEPYIERHIEMTRSAYGIDGFRTEDYPGRVELSWADVEEHQGTLDNIRLWDPRALLQTYGQLQEMRLYYRFVDADVGRYRIDGQYRQVLLSARELAIDQIQNRTWINEHLQYTHGYGLVMSPVNEVTRQGLPAFWISDFPPRSDVGLNVDEPRIYFGELTEQYVFVNTETQEFDYPMGDRNAFTEYTGTGGVEIGSFFRRLLYALRFGDMRLVLSTEFTPQTRVMYRRNIVERVRQLTPFLRFDRDPYLVLADGRLYWIMDGYTTSTNFPYAQPTRGWGNYVRNSVKVVIDAYNGTVDYYRVGHDPVLDVYDSLFPGWLKPLEAMPTTVKEHIRYPEDLLALQAKVYGTYHMEDTRVFYNREDVWNFAREVYLGREEEVVPYYLILQLPGHEEEEMVLVLPFTPAQRNNMIAWLAARNDGDHYGEVIVYQFPKDRLTLGPAQIEARIDQDSEISQLLTLWSQRGSQVIRGNLLVLPVGGGIVYAEPLYLQSDQSSMPQLQRVIVADQENLAMERTLELALARLFGDQLNEQQAETPPAEIPDGPPEGTGSTVINETLAERARQLYQEAADALRRGDFAEFGKAWEALEEILEQLVD